MSIITLVRRRIRLARIAATRQQQATLARAYVEQMSGLSVHLDTLEREHIRDIAANGPSSDTIARSIEARIKQPMIGPQA